ncbi:MAG: PBP1A family penicillin-binding protein [Proteobacteria bacterium]|nr:PBP1A family penicillin-binding protein [Pseudomonadota bacterium]
MQQQTKQETKQANKLTKYIKLSLKLGVIGFIFSITFIGGVIFYYAKDLPNFNSIADYKPKLITKVYAENNILVAEYAKEKRIYVPLEDIPEKIVKSLLATEDKLFYQHYGFDLKGIARAFIKNILFNSREGASTITQQLVKNLLLTNERTYSRKIKELILSYKIEKAFSKNEILELYLNHIYLGSGSYGVMQASLNYFNTDLKSLTNEQIAVLVGLPKAPNKYNPLNNPKFARYRRDIVLRRMLDMGIITIEEYKESVKSEIKLNPKRKYYGQDAPDFSEHIRRIIKDTYGEKELYTSGMHINTTLNMEMQKIAQKAVLNGVKIYDKRHGWRGPLAKLVFFGRWNSRVKSLKKQLPQYKVIGEFAYVSEIDDETKVAHIVDEHNNLGIIPFKELKWAREFIGTNEKGPRVKKVSDVLNSGDIILVRKLKEQKNENPELTAYTLEQFPKVQAALVAMDPKSGAVRALVGGFDKQGTFNRAIQAKRQVGSSFKPFVYGSALENGFQTNSIILDAPIVVRSQIKEDAWKPQNYSEKVYGPATLRRGLEKSRNLMTINLARKLGISKIIKFASKLGIPTENMKNNLSTALGTASISLIDMVSAYTVFANEGIYNKPFFIRSIQDFSGSTIYKNGYNCNSCSDESVNANSIPDKIDSLDLTGKQVISDTLAYMITDLMQGVVKRGTGWRAKKLGITVAAKTGTTNDWFDAWFMGFSPDLVIGVWSGFDNPQTLGNQETGSGVSGPIWAEFMSEAKKLLPNSNFKIPEDIVFVKVDLDTGQLPTSKTKKTILEVFRNGNQPNGDAKHQTHFEETSEDSFLEGIY